MPGFLRQSTASQSRALGPFLDDTDFKTPETGLTIANTDIKIVMNGGASADKNSGGGTHRVNGVYGVTFDATDTGTVGEMEVSVKVAGALIVFDKWTIVEEVVYDRDYAASALGYVAAQTVATVTTVTGLTASNLDATISSRASAAALATVQSDTDDIQTRLPAALIGGRMNSDMEAINNVVVNGTGVLGSEWGP